MNIVVIASAAVAAMLAMVVAIAIAYRNRHLALLDGMQIPEDVKTAARASFADARARAWGIAPYVWSAPIVMALVVPFVKRSANKMPHAFRRWDNEVSLNGDGVAVKRDGQWIRVTNETPALPGEKLVTYDNPEYSGDAYYAPGHHPRSAWARYVWLGWRNRASAAATEVGVALTEEDLRSHQFFGDIETSKSHEGTLLRRIGPHFQLYSCKKLGPLCIRTNYGFKIGNAVSHGRNPAMVVAIPFSILGWKGQ